ncbi:DMT family transporter [Hippea sp. KM1]|uniref:DMT family transporter n=1 Tax=Hippea sp. KM1 TaxID=944481 RepID=UPI00046D4483|nr:DMT family transporter [Hippea sp. KM1]
MSFVALSFVIFSALMHASYNFLYKRSKLKIIYLWSMFAFSIIVMSAYSLLFGGGAIFHNLSSKTLILAALAAIFFTLYQVYTGKAYAMAEGDLSVVYPLSITAPLYIPFLAYVLIGEKITVITFTGIALALVGTYLLQLNVPLSQLRFKKIDLKKKHIRYAAFAGFIYSFGAVVDKIGVGKKEFFIYTYWVVVFMFIYMSLNILRNRILRKEVFYCVSRSMGLVIAGGVFLTLSFLSYRYAMQLACVSATAGARQISSLFGVLMGIFILKEPYGSLRFFATLLVVLGVILIKIG